MKADYYEIIFFGRSPTQNLDFFFLYAFKVVDLILPEQKKLQKLFFVFQILWELMCSTFC